MQSRNKNSTPPWQLRRHRRNIEVSAKIFLLAGSLMKNISAGCANLFYIPSHSVITPAFLFDFVLRAGGWVGQLQFSPCLLYSLASPSVTAMLTIDGQQPSEKLTPAEFNTLSADVLLQIFSSLPAEQLNGIKSLSTAGRMAAEDEELWLDKLSSLVFEFPAGVLWRDRRLGESAREWYFRSYDFLDAAQERAIMHKKGTLAHLPMHGTLDGLEFWPHGGEFLSFPIDHGTLAELAQLGSRRGKTYPAAWAAAFFGDACCRALEQIISTTAKLVKKQAHAGRDDPLKLAECLCQQYSPKQAMGATSAEQVLETPGVECTSPPSALPMPPATSKVMRALRRRLLQLASNESAALHRVASLRDNICQLQEALTSEKTENRKLRQTNRQLRTALSTMTADRDRWKERALALERRITSVDGDREKMQTMVKELQAELVQERAATRSAEAAVSRALAERDAAVAGCAEAELRFDAATASLLEAEHAVRDATTKSERGQAKCYLLFTTHYSLALLTTHYSLLTTHYSLLITHYSLLTILTTHYLPYTYYSLLATHYSLLTAHCSPRSGHCSTHACCAGAVPRCSVGCCKGLATGGARHCTWGGGPHAAGRAAADA